MRQRSETLRASCTPDSRPMRAFRLLGRFQFLHPLLYPLILTLLSAPLTTPLRADTISGTVKDPSGAVVAGARIEISGGALAEPLVLTSDGSGKFVAPNLSAGKYSVRASKEGFDDLVTTVELNGTADLPVSLRITAQQTSVTVNEKSSAFANSDAVYRQLRSVGLGDTFRCENFTLPIDVGTFVLKSGTITFLGMVNKSQTGAIFVGQGHFTLKPLATLDTNEMVRRADGRRRLHGSGISVLAGSIFAIRRDAGNQGGYSGGGRQRLSALEGQSPPPPRGTRRPDGSIPRKRHDRQRGR